MPPVPKLRVTHPTDDLEAVIRFYRDGLELAVLYRFEDPDGYRIWLQSSTWTG